MQPPFYQAPHQQAPGEDYNQDKNEYPRQVMDFLSSARLDRIDDGDGNHRMTLRMVKSQDEEEREQEQERPKKQKTKSSSSSSSLSSSQWMAFWMLCVWLLCTSSLQTWQLLFASSSSTPSNNNNELKQLREQVQSLQTQLNSLMQLNHRQTSNSIAIVSSTKGQLDDHPHEDHDDVQQCLETPAKAGTHETKTTTPKNEKVESSLHTHGDMEGLIEEIQSPSVSANQASVALLLLDSALHDGTEEKNMSLKEASPNVAKFVQHGGMEAVLHAMRHFTNVASIQEHGCFLLSKLATLSKYQISIAAAGGVNLVLQAMKDHMDTSPDAVQQASAALRNLALNDANEVTIASAGGITILIQAMQKYMTDPQVVEQANGALRNLAGNKYNKDSIAAAGGVQIILDTMREHPYKPRLLEHACAALRNLAWYKNNRPLIAQNGGVTDIVHVMQLHREDVDIQVHACGALSNLAYNENNRAIIAAAGGIDAVLTAMSKHPDATDVQKQGCAALDVIAFRNDENKAAIVQAGGILMVLAAMERHLEESIVQMMACGALTNMVNGHDDDDEMAVLSQAGAKELLERVMRKHPSVMGVQQSCKVIVGWLENYQKEQ